MADPRFYKNTGPLKLQAFLQVSGLSFSGDPSLALSDVAAPETAAAHDLIFIENPKYLNAVLASKAGFVLARPELAAQITGKHVIESPSPQLHFIAAIHLLYPPADQPDLSDARPVSPSAKIDPSAQIEHGAVIGAGAEIGANSIIGANTVIGPGVRVGANCKIGASVTIHFAEIADEVSILSGARIGQDGFGFVTHQGKHIRMPQLGRVIIGAGSEIGANATIDRGALMDTVIGKNVIIDNLVMVGHNVQVGDGAILVSQSGVAGSTKLGKYAVLAAQAGVADHLEIGDFAQIGAQSGVMRDVEANARMMGSPAQPAREYFRQVSTLAKSGKNAKTSS